MKPGDIYVYKENYKIECIILRKEPTQLVLVLEGGSKLWYSEYYLQHFYRPTKKNSNNKIIQILYG